MPLTTTGIVHQIISSLKTYKIENLGTINDCKVVINHLIRKFSEPLSKSGNQKIYSSINAKYEEKTIREHLLPVNEVMNHLFSLDFSRNVSNLAVEIEAYLTKALVVVNLTKEEDQKLNSSGLQKSMPASYREPTSELFNDPWARYKYAEIYKNIEFPEPA